MGTRLVLFFCLPIATSAFSNNARPSHSIQISHKRPRISRTALTLVKVLRALRTPFQFALVPTPTQTTLEQNHRSTDSGLFYASSQVPRLTLSTPPHPRENNNKLKTMQALRVSFLGGKDWGGEPQMGTGQF